MRMWTPRNVSNNAINCGICVLALLFAQPINCTSVAVIRTPKGVAIAADSLAYDGGKPVTRCKIHSVGSIVFSAAGLLENRNTGFNVEDLAKQAAIGSDGAFDAEKRFQEIATVPFRRALTQIRRDARTYYDVEIKRGPEPLQVVFIAVEKGTPTFALAYFTVTDGRDGSVHVTVHGTKCPGDGCPAGHGITMLGDNEAAVHASNFPSFWIGLDNPTVAIRKLVEIEIEALSKRVGPPIDILSLDTTGQNWIETEGCKKEK